MLIVISPAKTLDFESALPEVAETECSFLVEAEQLISELRHLTQDEIGSLMSVSDKISQLNYERFKTWHKPFTKEEGKHALYAFKGDVYTGIDAYNRSPKAQDYLHKHLFILSGLYGLLKATDLILPYRLEMGTKFENTVGKNLYEFWGDKITTLLAQYLDKNDNVLINLASNEYFKSVKRKQLTSRIITPVFKDEKNGNFKVVSFFAKKARGLMCRFAAENNITNPEDLKQFNLEGYFYNDDLSSKDEWVFTRFEVKK